MKVLVTVEGIVLTLVLGVAVIAGGPGGSDALTAAPAEIPPYLLPVYMHAAATCEGLPWQVLAAIGWTESRHAEGRTDPATGEVRPPIVGPALDGRHGNARIPDATEPDGWAHAHGNMQFLKSTWTRWGRVAPGRPAGASADYDNAYDSIYSAAAYLCGGANRLTDLNAAILRYNHSAAYVRTVLTKATEYGLGAAPRDSSVGAAAVAAAMQELGVPYVYGGESPETGFDCSGLVQWAYAKVGVELPRVTFDQVRVGVPVAVNDLQPGDLIFTRGGSPPRDFGHVAMYVSRGVEINAPHTGAVVSLRTVEPSRIQAIRRP